MSINRFFKVFIDNNAEYGFDLFSKEVMQMTDLNQEKLKPYRDRKEGFPFYTRKMTGILPITGVPFCSSTVLEKSQKIIRSRP